MKALVKTKPGVGNVEIIDVAEPVCTEDGVKVEVKFAGICGTDIHVYHDTFKSYPPVTLCHEFSGVVTETGAQGADSIVECSGAGGAVSTGLKLVKKLGQYVQVGIPGKPITVDFDIILYKQLKVFGVLGHSLNTWEPVMKIFETEKIDLKPIISHTLPLSRWKDAFDLFERKQALKILLCYDE